MEIYKLADCSFQARGKWMIPMYKVGLFTSFGCSMYMMCRLFLVGRLRPSCRTLLTGTAGTQDMVGKELGLAIQ
jgi:hypothetical protein